MLGRLELTLLSEIRDYWSMGSGLLSVLEHSEESPRVP